MPVLRAAVGLSDRLRAVYQYFCALSTAFLRVMPVLREAVGLKTNICYVLGGFCYAMLLCTTPLTRMDAILLNVTMLRHIYGSPPK
jgi:hypothetical protein